MPIHPHSARARIAATLLIACRTAAAPPWQVPEAAFRRRLAVEPFEGPERTATTLVFVPGDGVAQRLSLLDSGGKPRGFTVIERSGSRCRLFFNTDAPGETLFLYIGSGPPTPRPWQPHRTGLLHQVRAYAGEPVHSIQQFDAAWKRGSEYRGGRFVAQVFSSTNPFGPNVASLHRYDGSIRIAEAGEYRFCTASTDASFLLVNGTPVASWPGRHRARPGLDGRHGGTIRLDAGQHSFSYLHANTRADACYAIAGVTPPGHKHHQIIPADWFSEAVYARVGRLERRTGDTADFAWHNRYQVAIEGRALYRCHFEAAGEGDWHWRFGDGTHARGREVTHIWARQGTFAVDLTDANSGASCRQTIRIAPRYGQDENDDREAIAAIRQAMAQARRRGIQPEAYATVTLHAFFYLLEREACTFAAWALDYADRIPDADITAMFLPVALACQQLGEQYDLAERCFRLILDRETDPAQRAPAALHCAGMLNLCLNRPLDARALLATIDAEQLETPWQKRLLTIYRADATLALEGATAAAAEYAAIAPAQPLIQDDALDRAALSRRNSRYLFIRNLLAQKNYRQALETLDSFEWETPTERLNPATNLLKEQALLGNQQPRKAAVCLERALLADADERLRPTLRLRLARLYLLLGDLIRSRKQISLITDESPFSPEEVAARELLQEIDARIDATLRDDRTPRRIRPPQ